MILWIFFIILGIPPILAVVASILAVVASILAVVASISAVVASTVARPWLVEKGYLFPKGETGSRSYAALGVATIFKPEMEHVIEEEQSRAIVREDNESGDQFDLNLD